MVDKDGTITINGQDFMRAQGESPFTGMGSVRNLEIFDVPGIAKIQWKTSLKYSTSGLPVAIVRDTYGNEYVGTSNGYIYKNGTQIGSGYTSLYDLAILEDYLVIAHSTVVALYGPINNVGAAFFGNWKTGLQSGYYKKIVVGQDNITYITNGPYIASIGDDFAGGTVGVAPTATWNTAALNLPVGNYARTMTEYGRYLAIGTQQGSSFADFQYGVGNVFFWDRSSTGANLGPRLHESGVNQLISIGTELYGQSGVYGNFYKMSTSDAAQVAKMNFNVERNATAQFYPNAIGKLGNEIIVGSGALSDAYTGSKSTHGVWSIKGKNSYLRNTISTGNVGADQTLQIGAILPLSGSSEKGMLIGWSDGSSYGVDEISNTQKYGSYRAFFESQVYSVGTSRNPKTYQMMEVALARPLVANQTIRVSYRTSLADDYTVLTTLTTANTPEDETSILIDTPIDGVKNIQFKVELSHDGQVLFNKNIDLMSIRFI